MAIICPMTNTKCEDCPHYRFEADENRYACFVADDLYFYCPEDNTVQKRKNSDYYIPTYKIIDVKYFVDIRSKLSNMFESEISEDVYDFIINSKNIDKLRDKVIELYPEFSKRYNIEFDAQLYNCDEVYMDAIISVFKDDVVPAACGYGMIKMKGEA